MPTRLEEIRQAIAAGASEIDIVINRQMALDNNWTALYDEVKAMKEACGPVHMKSILAIGELGSMNNVYKCSLVCMMAGQQFLRFSHLDSQHYIFLLLGSDFIKTSTGKEGVNATLAVGLVMCRAIRDYHERTGFRVGFKPAGGIR